MERRRNEGREGKRKEERERKEEGDSRVKSEKGQYSKPSVVLY